MDGTAVVTGRAAGMFEDVATSLKDVLEGPSATLNRVADDFNALSREWTMVGSNIRRLTNPDVTPEQVDAGEEVANLATVMARADKRMAELEQVLGGIDEYVNDDELRDDIKTTVANAREMTGKVMQTVESLRGDISGGVDALKKSYVALADDLSKAVASTQKLVDQMSEGEGTVGKMVNDPKLYDNLNDAAERLNVALDEIRLLVEKWKKEGLPVQF